MTVSHSMESSILGKGFKLEHFMHTNCTKFKKTLLTGFKSMASLSIASTTSRIKGHHLYEHKCQINDGEEFSCSLEPASSHGPSDNASTASALNEKLQKKSLETWTVASLGLHQTGPVWTLLSQKQQMTKTTPLIQYMLLKEKLWSLIVKQQNPNTVV